jgi:hypothetical protein
MPWYTILAIVLGSIVVYAACGLGTEWSRHYVWGVRPKSVSFLTFAFWPLAILWVGPFALLVRTRLYRRDVWTEFEFYWDSFGFKSVKQSSVRVIADTVEGAPRPARSSQ